MVLLSTGLGFVFESLVSVVAITRLFLPNHRVLFFFVLLFYVVVGGFVYIGSCFAGVVVLTLRCRVGRLVFL